MRSAVSLAAGLAGAAALVACAGSAPVAPRLVEDSRLAMGSTLRVAIWTADPPVARAAIAEVAAEFERLESLMSVWRPESDVVRLNAAAGDHPVPIGPDTREVLRAARQASEWTHGKFDITFGALADVWRFDHDQDNRVPTPAEIRARLPLVNHEFVVLDEPPGTAYIARAGAKVHLGGIGKGYAIDRAVALLRSRGLTNFLIQSGGDLYVAGLNGGEPWTLGIRDPRGPADAVFATLALSDGTFSTSGDYERYFMHDGRRYHHLIDPDRGEPARGCRSVTIVANSALVADALSTGVFILGPAEGMALVERLPDVEAVIVGSNDEVLVSSGLRGRVELRVKS